METFTVLILPVRPILGHEPVSLRLAPVAGEGESGQTRSKDDCQKYHLKYKPVEAGSLPCCQQELWEGGNFGREEKQRIGGKAEKKLIGLHTQREGGREGREKAGRVQRQALVLATQSRSLIHEGTILRRGGG